MKLSVWGKKGCVENLQTFEGQKNLEFVSNTWYVIPNMPSRLVFYEKRMENDGSIIEMKVWEVPVTERNPDGVRYSLYCVRGEKVLVGYDNHHPKGHHRHYGERQEPYLFTTIEDLVRDFLEDQRRLCHEG